MKERHATSGERCVIPLPTVLVVDDDDFMRTLLRRVLTDAGIAVETFASAAELLAAPALLLPTLSPALQGPAVLLLDVMMPGMSGLELQSVLRQRGIALPVVFLTGSSDVPMAVDAMRNGAVDFLEKPFDSAVLVERIQRALAGGSAAPTPLAPHPNPGHALRLATLTPREREVFDSMITGKTSKMIARDLGGSFRTIEIHRTRVMSKMAAASLADLVRMTFEVDAGAS